MVWGYFMKTVGSRVKSLRVSKRLSQTQLATACGVSQPAIAKIESDKTQEIKGYLLDALARELSSTTGYILRGSTNSEGHESDMLSAEMSVVFESLPVADKEMLIRLARGMTQVKEKPLLIEHSR